MSSIIETGTSWIIRSIIFKYSQFEKRIGKRTRWMQRNTVGDTALQGKEQETQINSHNTGTSGLFFYRTIHF
jgi:hypothetical protein